VVIQHLSQSSSCPDGCLAARQFYFVGLDGLKEPLMAGNICPHEQAGGGREQGRGEGARRQSFASPQHFFQTLDAMGMLYNRC
jgi:hypothetical protein